MNESSLAQFLASAHTAELAVRAVGQGLDVLGQRVEGLEHQAAGLRALARFLAAQRARRETEPVATVHRAAA